MFRKGLGAQVRSYVHEKKKHKKRGRVVDPRKKKMLVSINHIGYTVTDNLMTQDEVEKEFIEMNANETQAASIQESDANEMTGETSMADCLDQESPIYSGPDEMLHLESHRRVMEVRFFLSKKNIEVHKGLTSLSECQIPL
jgi:hypothetical protein